MSSSTFTNYEANSTGSLLYYSANDDSEGATFSFSDNLAKCQSEAYTYATDLKTELPLSNTLNIIGGSIFINNAATVTSYNNEIDYCYACSRGSAFSVEHGSFTDSNSRYNYNAAQ